LDDVFEKLIMGRWMGVGWIEDCVKD